MPGSLSRTAIATAATLVVTLSGVAGTFLASAASGPAGTAPTVVVAPAANPTPPRGAQCVSATALLKSGVIRFHTTTENKDVDTKVVVIVLDRFGNKVMDAIFGSSYGQWSDNSYNGDNLNMLLANMPYSRLQGGRIDIRVTPNGSDTWRFDYSLGLTYSDGNTVSTQAKGLELSNENPEFSITIS